MWDKKKQNLHFGSFGVQSLVTGRLQASVIEAMRRVMTRKLNDKVKFGFVFSQIFQLVKNQQKYVWVKEKALHLFGFVVFKKVKYFLNLTVVPKSLALQAMKLACHKLPWAARILV